MLQNKKTAFAGAGMDNAGPDPELVGLPSVEASISEAPLTKQGIL